MSAKGDESLDVWGRYLRQMEEAQEQLEGLAASVDESRQGTAGVCGSWNARQLLAHLEAWNIEILGNLRKLREGAAEIPEHDVDKFNREAVQARQDWSWMKVLARLRKSQQELRAHLRLCRSEGRPPTRGEREWVEVLVSHDQHHARQLEGWIA